MSPVKLPRGLLALACLIVTTLPAAGQYAGPNGTDAEVILEWDSFRNAGYREIEWRSSGAEMDDIAPELVMPDWSARNPDRDVPEPTFEFGMFEFRPGLPLDLVVRSRLPGDCGFNGCRTAVYRVEDGGTWSRVAVFEAMGVTARAGDHRREPGIGIVGDDLSPSYVLRWEGDRFVEVRG